jgi:hypothetical protein
MWFLCMKLWAALLLHFKEHETLVEGPLNNLQQSFMTFARPRRNIANDSRYAFTALARGAWDGHWEDRNRGYGGGAPGFGGGGGGRKGRNRRGQTDSRFDPRYDNASYYGDDQSMSTGVPMPNFAPLPDYGGVDDMSSVGGTDAGSVSGSIYTNTSQAQWSRGGGYYSDLRSQADSRY